MKPSCRASGKFALNMAWQWTGMQFWLLETRRNVVLLKKDKAKDNAKAIAKADIKTEPKVECKNAAGSTGAEAKKAKV